MEYKKRNISEILSLKTTKEQIIVLTGARQTGKTTLCEGILPRQLNMPYTYISFDDPDERLRFQNTGITILESIKTPLVILDEVQKIPVLFDQLKYVVDKQKRTAGSQRNIFILTGSSQLILLKNIKETLAGRTALMHLYPFSLSEVLEYSNLPLLSKIWSELILTDQDITRCNTISPEESRIILKKRDEHQTWGGYPPVWERSEEADRINWLKNYRTTYLERDISDVGQVANLDNFAMVQRLLCARTGQMLSLSEVARDLALAVNTVKRYVSLLEMTFQCYLVPPYYTNIGKRFVKSPKIYFPDAGLNRAILGEMTTYSGASYESWIFSELVKWKQLQPVEPDIFFYRTTSGTEVDFLIAGEGLILPVEVKSSTKAAYADGRSLESFMHDNDQIAPLGLIAYKGKTIIEVRKNIWAVPDWFLFGGLSSARGA
ncbi:MAG: ATP-binding protein [Proteobacteria bacterium]|nr:ATP-binding protein [Pseudomonadota bacterium]